MSDDPAAVKASTKPKWAVLTRWQDVAGSKLAVVVPPAERQAATEAAGAGVPIALAVTDAPDPRKDLRDLGYRVLVEDPGVPLTCEYGLALRDNFRHFEALQKIIQPTRHEWEGCGTYLMSPPSMSYDASMYPKQSLLWAAARHKRHILEIGVHAGHSLLIALLAAPHAHVTCVDTCGWDHVARCVEYLQRQFPGRITLLKGDSATLLEGMQTTFDLIHVDGDHSPAGVRADLERAMALSDDRTAFVIDDVWPDGMAVARDFLDVTHVAKCPWANCLGRKKRGAAGTAQKSP